jgi:hypothetical protein
MVRGGGAAREGELGQGGLRREEDVLGLEARPDRVERLEPVEQVGVLRGGDGARQGLVEVVVRVDQPRQEHVTRQVEDLVGFVGRLAVVPTIFDEAVANEKTTVREFGLVVVHAEQVGVLDE